MFEAIVQAVQSLRTAYYAGMSATIMFIWDYSELATNMFDRIVPLVYGSLSIQ
jgi:hypothetical protein